MFERQWPEDDGVERAEHRRRGADAERQREHGDEREAGRLGELAERERYVLAELIAILSAARVAIAFVAVAAALRVDGFRVAESAFSFSPRLFGSHSLLDEPARRPLHMEI